MSWTDRFIVEVSEHGEGFWMLREILKAGVSKISPELLERALALSVVKNKFENVKLADHFACREDLWLSALERVDGLNLVFLEFGVWEGYSIRYFADHAIDESARFYGFDSFEGLPESWADMPRGAFSTNGAIPKVADKRVKFVKGLFQNTLPGFLRQEPTLSPKISLVVHFDADLYSSTLYCLSQIDSLKTKYIAIFDEFTGHESRALYNYLQSFSAEVRFLGKVCLNNNWPTHLMCEISPTT